MTPYMIARANAASRLLVLPPPEPGEPYRASDSRHSAMPMNPMTSSHSSAPPTGVELMECSAPVRSACCRERPKATWTAIQPMMTYVTPFAARLPVDRAPRLLWRRAVRVTKVVLLSYGAYGRDRLHYFPRSGLVCETR